MDNNASQRPVEPSISNSTSNNISVISSYRSKMKLFVIIGSILITFLLCTFAGIYFLGTKSSINTNENSSASENATTLKKAPNSDDSSQISWEVYSNSSNGYSFQYPNTWQPQADNEGGILIYSDEKIGDGPEPLVYFVYSDVLSNPNRLSFKEIITSELDTQLKSDFTYQQTTINGYTVYKTESLPSRSGEFTVFFQKDDGSYTRLALSPYDKAAPFQSQDKYIKIFNQILNTFKFTSSSSYTETYNITGYYKTYQGEAWGKKATCDSFVVTGGDMQLTAEFKEMIRRGNTVNKLDENGNLQLNVTIPNESSLSQTIINSSFDSQITLSVMKKKPTDTEAPVCFSFVDIISAN